jgi:dephospho-CoA kinase
MIIVGLTGGIGSGKTTVVKFFVELGVPVYNSDKEARKLMKSSKTVKKAIIELLGKNAYNGKKLNKTYISDKIFENEILLNELNGIVHPAVRKHFLRWVKRQKTPYVIQETALIFENSSQDFYDKIILVTAPEVVRIQRVMERSKLKKKLVVARIKNQWLDAKKAPLSDYIINNLELSKTESKVEAVNNDILSYS